MLKLDNNLLQELGLGSLPEEQKKAMLQHIYETLELRVGTNLANQMTDQQLEEFEKFIDEGGDANQAQALQWLESNLPNYKEVVNQVFEQLKGEIGQMAPQIMASSSATPTTPIQQQPQPQQMPAASPSQYQAPQQPQPAPQPAAAYQPPAPSYPQQGQPQPAYQPPQAQQQSMPQQPPAAPQSQGSYQPAPQAFQPAPQGYQPPQQQQQPYPPLASTDGPQPAQDADQAQAA